MRNLSEIEVLSLSGILKSEQDGLVVARALNSLIKDDEVKKHSEASILATEGRIKSIQQFITENKVTNVQGGQ